MGCTVTTHEMVLAGRASSGAEEWHCPDCGRRMLLRWPPDFEKIILEPGDDRIPHVGGKGGVRMRAEVTPQPLDQDRSWLKDNGNDWDAGPA